MGPLYSTRALTILQNVYFQWPRLFAPRIDIFSLDFGLSQMISSSLHWFSIGAAILDNFTPMWHNSPQSDFGHGIDKGHSISAGPLELTKSNATGECQWNWSKLNRRLSKFMKLVEIDIPGASPGMSILEYITDTKCTVLIFNDHVPIRDEKGAWAKSQCIVS